MSRPWERPYGRYGRRRAWFWALMMHMKGWGRSMFGDSEVQFYEFTPYLSLRACECCSFGRCSFPMVWLSARAGLRGGRRGPMHSPFDLLEQVPGQPAYGKVQCPGGLLISLPPRPLASGLRLIAFAGQDCQACVSLWGGSTINEPSNVRPKREQCRLEPGSRKDPLAKAVEAVEEAEAGGGGRRQGPRGEGSRSENSESRSAKKGPWRHQHRKRIKRQYQQLVDRPPCAKAPVGWFHHVWEGGGDEEERSPDNNSSANNKKDKDVTNDEAMAPEPLGPALELDFDAAAETYDDCCAGDYPDEPDILFEGGRISSSHIDPDEKSAGWGDIEDCDESEFVDTPIFRHLTDHFSFKQRDAIDAMKAS
ncbi:hypothetical protein THAOC_18504, partial [Thalassiosira oceanica]